MPREKYGGLWKDEDTDLHIEMDMIRSGGYKEDEEGKMGNGLIYHYEEMRKILWPWVDDHRWYKTCRDEIISNRITVLMGCGNSGKTFNASWIYLCEYFCFPEETCILISSTDMNSLRRRVWAEIQKLWQMAVDQYDWLPGHPLESKCSITTDNINEKDFGKKKKTRDARKGIIGVPCLVGGQFVGLSRYVGVKAARMRLLGDECQFMPGAFLSAFSNLAGNVSFRATLCGNPLDILDTLGKAAEPKEGWSAHLNPTKTDAWDTKFFDGRCVNLVGLDSPNFDQPETKYPYLVKRETVQQVIKSFGKDSSEYYSQIVGNMNISVLDDRVLTRDMCRQHKALEDVVWAGTPRTKIFGLDAAYGGDRCVGGHVEFGKDIEGNVVVKIVTPEIVPIVFLQGENYLPEKQISEWIHRYCIQNGIPPENVYYDATGRGSLGTSLSKEWSDQCNPIEFGGPPTDRPVSLDMYVVDPKTHQRRLKKCSEHYIKFVTELWFTVRYAVEAGQVRGLPEDVMDEFCTRKWRPWKEFKKELETKQEMKERTTRSPDLADWCATCFEGARRRGFQIAKLANEEDSFRNLDWLEELRTKQNQFRKRSRLNYAV